MILATLDKPVLDRLQGAKFPETELETNPASGGEAANATVIDRLKGFRFPS